MTASNLQDQPARHSPTDQRGSAATMTVVMRPVHSLVPDTANPRVISRREMAKLRHSLRQFGMVVPLVVRSADGRVIGGHQRLAAAMAEGYTEVPCVVVDLDDRQADILNLALNKVGGSWDVPKLAEMLADLSAQQAPLELTGFESDEIDRLLGVLDRAATEEVPPPGDEPGVEVGGPSGPPDDSPDDSDESLVCPRCGWAFSAR